MEQPEDVKLLEDQRLLSWDQIEAFRDDSMAMLAIRSDKDHIEKAVMDEAERLGLTIETIDVTVEVQVRAYAK